MGRWLSPRLPGPQHWVEHDRDAALLDHAGPGVEARRSDITRLTAEDLAGASLVTASALLDLLTLDGLARMLVACAGSPMLLALTVVGRVTLTPEEPLDDLMGAAFSAHQRGGRKLGPDAVAVAVDELRGTGAERRRQNREPNQQGRSFRLHFTWLVSGTPTTFSHNAGLLPNRSA